MQLQDKVEHIELKVRQVVKRLARLEAENADLRAENQALMEAMAQRIEHIGVFKEKLGQTQSRFREDMKDKRLSAAAIKERVVKYMRELRQCITWLEKKG